MQVVTGKEMGEIDRYTIEELGIPGVVLMETAGRKVAQVIINKLDKSLAKVVILAGHGNNGGDGFVIARVLAQAGLEVEVFLLGEPAAVSGEAETNLDILKNLNIGIKKLTTSKQIDNIKATLATADLLVDALLGTGIKGELRGLFPDLIKLLNKVETEVLAVDIPSGVEADTGQIAGKAVKADLTVSFALPKLGQLLYPGAAHIGELKVVDIGIPQSAIDNHASNRELLTETEVSALLPARKANSHKGDYGKLLVLAGSTGLTGAATLAAQASLRAGCGLVTVGIPASLNSILETKLTEAMTYPLPDSSGNLTEESFTAIKQLAAERDVLAVGPGLGRTKSTAQLIKKVLGLNKPLILDADGLNVLADYDLLDKLALRDSATVLTPHPGELARLLEVSLAEVEANRINLARELAREYGVVLVLKGARTVIACPQGAIYLNQTGNSGLATGGSGDILTGLIAGFTAQLKSEAQASRLAVYLHGAAADLAVQDLTEYSLLPSDLLDYLPQAIKRLSD